MGGHLDLERRSAWGEDTLVNLFSVTKMAPARCAHLMAQQGRLDLAAPVATYWPEFAGRGKDAVTLADVLAHRCGVPTVREPLSPEDLFDWERITGIIADTEPWFEPGASCAYEAYTFGFIIGEVIRRVDGRAFGRFLDEEIAAPRGLDLYVGLPTDHDRRVSPLHPAAGASPPPEYIDELAVTTLTNPAISVGLRNSSEWRRAEVPSSNGQATARSLAQLCGALADDDTHRELLDAATVERIVRSGGPCTDRVLSPFMGGAAMDWSLGFMRNPAGVFGLSTTAIGYTGMGRGPRAGRVATNSDRSIPKSALRRQSSRADVTDEVEPVGRSAHRSNTR